MNPGFELPFVSLYNVQSSKHCTLYTYLTYIFMLEENNRNCKGFYFSGQGKGLFMGSLALGNA